MTEDRVLTLSETARLLRRAPAFWRLVDRRGPDDCWIWLGPRNPKGYGRFDHRVWHFAHRFSLALDGRSPAGMVSRHHCDNPPCVNPAHLAVGTNDENMRDRTERGRAVNGAMRHPLTQCVNGHPYPESRGTPNPTSGKSQCRVCHKLRERVRKARLRA